MHGLAAEERKRSRNVWTIPTRSIVAATADGSSSSTLSSANSFSKDGRKISVGDSALFKPAQDSRPFVGLIHWLTVSKENKITLGVNWLYRPAEVKLGKGVLLEAAPNEIFYSFHKDEISAESLLHPCKVAFLRKGVELPSGVSSFVCRRVYDITNKRLWWLTDQDFLNEQQEEIDQLLYQTQIRMHATLQPGGRSPKPMSGPTSTSQLKAGSDSVQNSASSLPSQVKGKKRERADQGSEPVKRERTMKTDDGDSGLSRVESNLKSEILKFTEKGGLIDSEGVERLVQLMLPERNEKKIDLNGRSMLAGVIAATDKFDCLGQFVQLRGVPVFDEWLQEVHKGKIGDGEKNVEEFLLVLLRALDKLPVNLHALQMCHIGKSVNHLRTHKNLEIQKKARSLVDTWKRRVEAEMNINDAKSGSNQAVPWSSRLRLPEVSHGGNRHSGTSTDAAIKSSVTQLSASKTASVKLIQGESVIRSPSASASPGSMKLVPSPAPANTNVRDGQVQNAAGGTSDLPLTTARDEKSSSSSQSHNSQSCSSDHTKTGGLSVKEDARSSSAGSMHGNKVSGGSSRHRKSVNGFPGSAASGVQREITSSKSSLHKNPASEKLLQSEKPLDGPVSEANSLKLIVKISNRGRSPAQSASGGSVEDPSIMNSRASSPVLSEKHDQFDRTLKEKSDTYRANVTSDVNTESWQSNDFKDVLTGCDDGDGSPVAIADEERCRTGEDSKKIAEAKAASSSSGNELESANLQDASLRSINALIDSCVKYSETNASMSIGDDVGMNLLASVAAGEMSKSDLVSPINSPLRNTPTVEHCCTGSDPTVKVKSSLVDDFGREESQSHDGADEDHEKQGVISTNFRPKVGEGSSVDLVSGEKPMVEYPGYLTSSGRDLQQTADACVEGDGKSAEIKVATSMASSTASTVEKTMNVEGSQPPQEKKMDGAVSAGATPDVKEKASCSLVKEDDGKDEIVSLKVEMNAVEGLGDTVQTEQNPSASMMHSDDMKGSNQEVVLPSSGGKDVLSENCSKLEAENIGKTDVGGFVGQIDDRRNEQDSNALSSPENRISVGLAPILSDRNGEHVEENLESKEDLAQRGRATPHMVSSALAAQETEQPESSRGSKLIGTETEDAEECISTIAHAASIPVSGVSDMDAKVEFDLNEGFSVDDGKFGEHNNLAAPACSAAIRLVSPLPFSLPSGSSGLPASITITAAAKGPFVPPDDLLKSKGELGWKGSAATSAFRPAEPRKPLEMSMGTTSIPLPDATAGKQSRLPLDIDLNVPDERFLEDLVSRNCTQEPGTLAGPMNSCELACEQQIGSKPLRGSGGLDLDLNLVDDASDMGNYATSSNTGRVDVPLLPIKSPSSSALNGAMSGRRDFDLNNGPVVDEVCAEPLQFSQQARSSLPSQPPLSGLRMNNTEMGNFAPWFPSGSTYSAIAIPSIMPDRGEQPFPIVAPGGPQRMLGPTGSSSPFSPDVYRGPVLSSAPTVPFPSSSFQYPVFPFGTSFPLPSATFSGGSTTYMDSSSGGKVCFPAVRPQFLGPPGAVSSQFPRPFVVSFPDGSSNISGESSKKWGRQGLDLNAGPVGLDVDGRDEPSLPLRHLSLSGSQAPADKQARTIQMAGGVSKRKEPEGGWDGYKQSSWQ
ncbi:uncharacterized protein LOC122289887 isoform X1 [Carya illinoinensis]|uniref:Uncharacterized protein n=1 Tax=Carya illinoinensis TaxID=32201 RepID=A0A922IUP2_CARIL|nr:uncharacterized protein LOC122289887 isoform X1 [Carya illinoinensis]KAG6683613.1 hypothetical protein I3842_12G023000 [Carya illinoinensis]KAG6683616.1 hypothetical protein I3842_12G023000 [Carya illinoinensis]KAG6683617.1 hypothetical protein I3842_12G023000 [Carya illinoinensis]